MLKKVEKKKKVNPKELLQKSYTDKIQEELETRQQEIDKLTQENNELLKTNGKLFQRIGFDKPKEQSMALPEKEEKLLDINDVIDSKGNIIRH